MHEQAAAKFYYGVQPQLHEQDSTKIAVRVFGSGPPLVMIHGYPTHGYTWRLLLKTLATTHTCYVIDLPGLGDSQWTSDTDFSFTAQARRLTKLFTTLIPARYSLMGHDTGATLARMVAAANPEQLGKLIIINTEMPGHRPPWIRFHQQMSKLPGALASFQIAMNSRFFQRLPMGMREFYSDKSRFDDPAAIAPYVDRLVASKEAMFGAIAYLRGIEWSVVDNLEHYHSQINSPVLFLWGEDDKTFPVDLGQEMSRQFAGVTRFERIAKASLLPHEEQPAAVLDHLRSFLT